MGFKTSLILIENKNNFSDDRLLLKTLGKEDFKYVEETTFDECMYPQDESINIGYYNNCIVIADDFILTSHFIDPKLHLTEKRLMELFPESEIISLMCHSVVNAHGYSVLKNGKKIRAKALDADKFYFSEGEPLEEEKELYGKSVVKDGQHYWKYENEEDDEEELMAEDQLMEDFAFGVGARLLGARVDCIDDYFLDELPFKKYKK